MKSQYLTNPPPTHPPTHPHNCPMSHHSCIWPFGVRISITQESAGNKNKQLKQEFAKQGCHYKRKELPASILRYHHFTRAPFLLHIQAHFIQIQGGVQAFRATLQKHESKAVGCTYQHVLTTSLTPRSSPTPTPLPPPIVPLTLQNPCIEKHSEVIPEFWADWRHQYGNVWLELQTLLSGDSEGTWCKAAVFAGWVILVNVISHPFPLKDKTLGELMALDPLASVRPISIYLIDEKKLLISSHH